MGRIEKGQGTWQEQDFTYVKSAITSRLGREMTVATSFPMYVIVTMQLSASAITWQRQEKGQGAWQEQHFIKSAITLFQGGVQWCSYEWMMCHWALHLCNSLRNPSLEGLNSPM